MSEEKKVYPTVNQHNINDIVAIRLNRSRREVAEYYKTWLDVLRHELQLGNDVILNGFLSIVHKDRDARIARNPRTGEAVEVPARTVIKTYPRTLLYDLDKGYEDVELTEEQEAKIAEYREKRIAE